MDTLNGICETWLGLAHSPRQDSSHVYGSIHFDAGADIIVQQVSEAKEKSLGIGLNITKANDTAVKQPMFLLGYGFDDLGLTDIWRPRSSEFPELMLATPVDTATEIFNYLSEVDAASAGTIAASIGKSRSMVSSILSSNPDTYEAERIGKEQHYKVRGLF